MEFTPAALAALKAHGWPADSSTSEPTGIARDQPPQARGIVNLHMSLSSTGANSAVAPPKM